MSELKCKGCFVGPHYGQQEYCTVACSFPRGFSLFRSSTSTVDQGFSAELVIPEAGRHSLQRAGSLVPVRKFSDAACVLQRFPETQAVVAELRRKYGVKSVGAEGFCWGGHYVVALLGQCITPLA